MIRKTAHDFDQELLALFDAYVHGAIDRRAFLDRAAKFAVGGVTAVMLLDQLSPNFAAAQVVKTDDGASRLKTSSTIRPTVTARCAGTSSVPRRRAASCPASW
jgi:carboxymethylenebutenolidase